MKNLMPFIITGHYRFSRPWSWFILIRSGVFNAVQPVIVAGAVTATIVLTLRALGVIA